MSYHMSSGIGNKLRPPSFKQHSRSKIPPTPNSNLASSAAGPAPFLGTPPLVGKITSPEPPTAALHQHTDPPGGQPGPRMPAYHAHATPPHPTDPLLPANPPCADFNPPAAPGPTPSSQRRLRRVKLALRLAFGPPPGHCPPDSSSVPHVDPPLPPTVNNAMAARGATRPGPGPGPGHRTTPNSGCATPRPDSRQRASGPAAGHRSPKRNSHTYAIDPTAVGHANELQTRAPITSPPAQALVDPGRTPGPLT